MILQTEAIVLKTMDLRETSRIARFFSKDHGKVSGVLKGIRKDHKKFGSSVDKFSVNDIVYYQSRNSDLHLISQCDLKNYFFPIRQDLKKSLAVSYILELVDKIMPVEEPNRDVYQLMTDFLTALETAADINTMIHIFQIKILLFSGFRPHLDSCLKCQRKITSRAKFSMRLGGLVCLTCPLNETGAILISQGAVASILHVEKSTWETCLRLSLTPAVKKELKFILNNFLVYHLGGKIKSEKYLE